MGRMKAPQYRIDASRIRRELGLTQEEFAAKLGVSRSAVCNWDQLGYQPNAAVLPIMAMLVGCKIEDLYDSVND